MKKRFLPVLLALILCVGLAAPAFAADDDFWIEDGVLTNYVGDAERVVVPDGVTAIGDGAFWYSGVTSVVLPDSVISIGKEAFDHCEELTSISLPRGLTSIGAFAFSGCKNLRSIDLPRSLTSIGQDAFALCDGLTSVVIPDGVTKIEEFVFLGCVGLTSVTIPDSVTSIGYGAFWGCKNLTGVNIPESVTAIGAEAFSGCAALTGITIPSGVTKLERRTFADCPALTWVVLPDNITDINMYAFENSPNVTAVRANGQTVDGAKFELPPLRNTYSQTLSGGAVYNLEVGDVLNLTNPAVDNSMAFPSYYFELKGNQNGILYAPNTNGSTAQFTAVKPGTVTVTGTLIGSIPKTNYGKEYNIATKKWESYTYITYEQQTLSTTATIVVTGSSQPASPAFTDLAPNAFYLTPVSWAVENGITTGTTATTFSPNKTCTHAEILTFLWRAAGSPESGAQPPIALKGGEFYYKAVKWAAEKGMIGSGFQPNAPCSRGSAVTYIWQAFGKPAAAYDGRFSDVPAGSPYAAAVAWAVEKGVTTGATATSFSPDKICNRGEIVTFLYRAYK